MAEGWVPELRLSETGGRCRLSLAGLACGDGPTLQEAADDLVARLLNLVMAVRSSGFRCPSELGPPDPALLGFVWELGEFAARGDDIRERLFGSETLG